MRGHADRKKDGGGRANGGAKPSGKRVAGNARSNAQLNLATALATVFSAGVYTKEELQHAVCTFVSELKDRGEPGEGVVTAVQALVNDVGAQFPASDRTKVLLADMVTWCLAEYYRESA